ncbi:unnamed protein product [Rotaria socialis]|uniref:Uncharacterized protein n=1 Tax=Rotaria socialis TaxID=392032 RepID=A0A821UEI5_9BILA|nr:unnamed protein product [Rotaria socialis]
MALLPRICSNILPRIHDQEHSTEEILRTANFPQLYSLSLLNFQENNLYQYLTALIIVVKQSFLTCPAIDPTVRI